MFKKLNDLNLIDYDDDNIKHKKFKNLLLSDLDFRNYFGDFFIKNSDNIFSSSEDLEVNKAYLLMDKDMIVGMIRIFSYHEAGFINLQYAVNPELRNLGYGTKILKEITKYFFENNIKCIDLNIDKNNIGSIKCAKNIGFEIKDEKYRLRR
ncbi:MAG: GNAT family N-acetyltransferase [Bacilli bacterium]|nr:GNAT family N-acetyltransferase [Bacilli bacterium]